MTALILGFDKICKNGKVLRSKGTSNSLKPCRNGVFFMPEFNDPLDNISIASPCSADWDEMYGDNRSRFCGDCKLNVYNLSGMTRDEAQALIINAEGRVCVRFYRRADGTVITQDCPVGWAKIKQRTKVYAAAVASLIMALFTGVLLASLSSKQTRLVGELRMPFATPTPMPTPEGTMGMIALPPPKNTNSSNVIMGKPSFTPSDVQKNTRTNRRKFNDGKVKALTTQAEG